MPTASQIEALLPQTQCRQCGYDGCAPYAQAIAHGLWNKARTLAALGEHLPAANIEIEVEFKKPVRLPSEVTLHASVAGPSGQLWLKGSGEIEHMVGRWRPIG